MRHRWCKRRRCSRLLSVAPAARHGPFAARVAVAPDGRNAHLVLAAAALPDMRVGLAGLTPAVVHSRAVASVLPSLDAFPAATYLPSLVSVEISPFAGACGTMLLPRS
jgi:hypothetical protein